MLGLPLPSEKTMITTLLASVLAIAFTPQTSPKPLSPQELKAPCVELLTTGELQSLGRKDVLTRASAERPGTSLCEWTDAKGNPIVVGRQTAELFKRMSVSGPKEHFDEEKVALDKVVGTDPVRGVGLEALITRHDVLPRVLIRREADVLSVYCGGCSRDQLIAVAKLAAAP